MLTVRSRRDPAPAPEVSRADAEPLGADLAFIAWAVVAICLVVAGVHHPLIGVVIAAGAIAVPGRLLTSWIRDPAVRLVLMPLTGAASVALIATVEIWLGQVHPRSTVVVELGASAGLLAARFPWRRLTPSPRVRPPDWWPPAVWRLWWFWLAAAAVPPLWVVACKRTDTDRLGVWGLLAALPPLWYLTLLLAIALVVWCLTRRQVEHLPTAVALVLLTLVLYGTFAMVEPVPHLPWVYAHVDVVDLFTARGRVDRNVDIYNRWPTFFVGAQVVGGAAGFRDPVSYVAWAEVTQSWMYLAAVAVLARQAIPDRRLAWGAAATFTCADWIQQNYFSPQGFAFALYLGIAVLYLHLHTADPGPLGLAVERRVRKTLRVYGPAAPARSQGRSRASVATILLLTTAVVMSHQLTPYLTMLQVVPLALLGLLRPRWLAGAIAGITLGFLVPNIVWINKTYGLIDNLNPLSNLTATPVLRPPQSVADLWHVRSGMLLAACLVALGLAGVIRHARERHLHTAVVVGWLMVAPAAMLLGQSYGGEGPLRVALFALPWSAIGTMWLVKERPHRRHRTGRPPSPRFRPAAVVVMAVTLLLPAYYQQESLTHIAPADLRAARWLDANSQPGDGEVRVANNFTGSVGAGYSNFRGYVWNLFEFGGKYPTPLSAASMLTAAGGVRSASGRVWVVLSPNEDRWAEEHPVYEPHALADFEAGLGRLGAVKVYDRGGTRVYRYSPGKAGG